MLNAAKIPNIFDLIYPVNAIYLTVGSEDPNVLFGGKWEKLAGGFALTTTDNTGGGDASAANAINHKPGSTYQGGLPNITGSFKVKGAGVNGSRPWYDGEVGDIEGAFGVTHPSASKYYISSASSKGSASEIAESFTFDATKSSNRYGMYQSTRVSVVADHIAVVAWKRTAVGGRSRYIVLLLFLEKKGGQSKC